MRIRVLECPLLKGHRYPEAGPESSLQTQGVHSSRFYKLGSKSIRADIQTEVFAAHDKRYFYVLFVCHEPKPEGVKADALKNGPRAWLDDNVELFLDPCHGHDSYYRLVVNPRGMTYATREMDSPWQSQPRVKASIGTDCWTVWLAIPFSALGIKSGTLPATWGINFGRTRRAGNTEYSSWAPAKESFHEPLRFGDLFFNGRDCPLESFSYYRCRYLDRLRLRAQFTCHGERCFEAAARLVSPAGKERARWFKNIGPGKNLINLSHRIEETGTYVIEFKTRDCKTDELVYAGSYPIAVEKPLQVSLPEHNLSFYQKARSVPVLFRFRLPSALTRKAKLRVTVIEGRNIIQRRERLSLPSRTRRKLLRIPTPAAGDYKVETTLQLAGTVVDRETLAFCKPFPSGMVVIRGCELETGKGHLIFLNVPHLPRAKDTQTNINDANRSSGLAIIAHIAMSSLEQMLALRGFSAIEVYNRSFFSCGETEKWDALLSRGRTIWATAVDDTHRLDTDAGKGWVMLRSGELSLHSILGALRRGSFYATTGPAIEDIRLEGAVLCVKSEEPAAISFIGPQGRVLKRSMGTQAHYEIKQVEGYVRAEVQVGNSKAWAQPLRVSRGRIINPYDESGRWYKGNLHAHTASSDGSHHVTEVWRWYQRNGYDFLAITDHG